MSVLFAIYVAKNGNKYLQTTDRYVANAVHIVTNCRYYKLLINGRTIYSFCYSDELYNALKVLDTLKLE